MNPLINAFKKTSITILFIFLISFLAIPIPAQVNKSKITFVETKHDFGKVPQGEELVYQYKFTNVDEDTLRIDNVRASCGCTGVTLGNKKNFAKGEKGEIKVTFSTTGRNGIQNKTISVQSNDPNNPNVMLSFTCDIVSK